MPRVGGGIERYARQLIPALIEARPDLRLIALANRDAHQSLRAEPWSGEVEWVRVPVGGGGRPWRLLAELSAVSPLARRRRAEIVHSLGNVAPPILRGAASVLTLHDVIWAHDPESMSRLSTATLRLLVPLSARRCDRVIAVSRAARDDIVSTLGISPEKVDVVHQGVTLDGRRAATPEPELRARFGLSARPFVLCVAAKKTHKNLGRLIEAVSRLDDPEPVLVLPGPPTPHERELRALAARLGLADQVRFLDRVSEADLDGLYRAATCFVLPSLHEGFGLPVLEAMARGLPVACSSATSLPEVAGDAALLFEPTNVEAIAEAIRRLLGDPQLREQLSSAGLERCSRFTWRATAAGTLASYERALERRRRSRT